MKFEETLLPEGYLVVKKLSSLDFDYGFINLKTGKFV